MDVTSIDGALILLLTSLAGLGSVVAVAADQARDCGRRATLPVRAARLRRRGD